jgi:hypothetical protein
MPKLGLPVSYLTAPYHLTYFSPGNLSALLSLSGRKVTQMKYRRGPSLRYELGNTHLWGAFKRDRGVKTFIRLIAGYALTALLWTGDLVVAVMGFQGFQMYAVIESGHLPSTV